MDEAPSRSLSDQIVRSRAAVAASRTIIARSRQHIDTSLGIVARLRGSTAAAVAAAANVGGRNLSLGERVAITHQRQIDLEILETMWRGRLLLLPGERTRG